jgi:DNA invertase Pin-like site-specific DNA recombinase
MKTTARVYSYLRFSDPKQAKGASAERQSAYAKKWAEEHGLTLDTSLSMKDEGLSAYHQQHVKKGGALGTFLKAIEEGRIPPGSVLVVEGLDRLSRATPMIAQAQLAQIINAGLTVVTASDNKVYNLKTMKSQPMDLVYSVLVMIRAHEESEVKSVRVTDALRRKCENWVAGTWRGIIRMGSDPGWVRADMKTGRFELIPERVAAIRMALSLYRQGYGLLRIGRMLAEAGLDVTPAQDQTRTLRYMLAQPSLMGDRLMTFGKSESYLLEGYYPPVLTRAEFAELQHLIRQRTRTGKGEIANILTGVRITHCGYCRLPFSSQNYAGKTEGDKVTKSYRRLSCSSYRVNVPCEHPSTCHAEHVERAIMQFCSDRLNLSALYKADARVESLSSRLALKREALAKTEAQITRITDALLDDEGEAPAAFVRKARELEKKRDAEQHEVSALEFEYGQTTSRSDAPTAKAWEALCEGVQSLDYDARMKARELIQDTFSRIEIYGKGFDGETPDVIDILLVARQGATRTLRINRSTGEWMRTEDIMLAAEPAKKTRARRTASA